MAVIGIRSKRKLCPPERQPPYPCGPRHAVSMPRDARLSAISLLTTGIGASGSVVRFAALNKCGRDGAAAAPREGGMPVRQATPFCMCWHPISDTRLHSDRLSAGTCSASARDNPTLFQAALLHLLIQRHFVQNRAAQRRLKIVTAGISRLPCLHVIAQI